MFKQLVLEMMGLGFCPNEISKCVRYNKRFLRFIRKKPKKVKCIDVGKYLIFLKESGIKKRRLRIIEDALYFFYSKVVHKVRNEKQCFLDQFLGCGEAES